MIGYSIGALQGMVLSPFLFTLYSYNPNLQKISYDSAIVGCISEDDEEEFRVVLEFIDWCEQTTCCSTKVRSRGLWLISVKWSHRLCRN